VRVLRDVLDEVRDMLQWCSKNIADFPACLFAMSEVGSLAKAALPPLASTEDSNSPPAVPSLQDGLPAKQRQLF
jgi:hypothetical protein